MTREEALEMLKYNSNVIHQTINGETDPKEVEALDMAIKALGQEPERKKGKWTATYSDCGGDVWVSWKCSNCGYVRKKGWEHNGGEKPDALFCEMCNADMRGEEDGWFD